MNTDGRNAMLQVGANAVVRVSLYGLAAIS